jgi:hypothetical protein
MLCQRYRLTTISIIDIDYRLSINDYRLSIIDYRLSIIDYRLSIIDYRLSIIDYRLSIIDIDYRYVAGKPFLRDKQDLSTWLGFRS